MFDGESRVRRFEELVLPHLPDLYRGAVRFTRSAAEAQDLVQEACLRAFRKLDQLTHPEATRAWLFTILRSVYLRQAERRGAWTVPVDEVDLSRMAGRWTDLDPDSPLRGAVLEEIRGATLRLPVALREVLMLAHVGGFSYQEIATILDVPIGTVMSRLFRARQGIRAALYERCTPASGSG